MRTKSPHAEPVRPERSFVQLRNEVDPVTDVNYLSGFVDGVPSVTDLDYDADLSAVMRAIRRPRAEGRHELLAAVATWIRARMAGRTAGEIVDVEIPMKRSSSTKTTPRANSLARIEPTSAAPPLAEKDPESETRIRLTAAGTQFTAQASGCNSSELGFRFLTQVRAVVRNVSGKSIEDHLQQVNEAAAFMASVGPAGDAIEGALAAQMCACHAIAMRCLAQAANERDVQRVDVHLNRAGKLLRAFSQQLGALDGHRGRGRPQTVRVEHVHVNAGGQAIVGPVEVKEGGRGKP